MALAVLTSFLCCDHKTSFRPNICYLVYYVLYSSDRVLSSSSLPSLVVVLPSSPRPFLGSPTWHHTPATTRLPTMNLPLSLSKCQPCWNGPCSLCQPRSNCSVGPNVAKNNVDCGGILCCILVGWWLRDASEPPDSEHKGGHIFKVRFFAVLVREVNDFPWSKDFQMKNHPRRRSNF